MQERQIPKDAIDNGVLHLWVEGQPSMFALSIGIAIKSVWQESGCIARYRRDCNAVDNVSATSFQGKVRLCQCRAVRNHEIGAKRRSLGKKQCIYGFNITTNLHDGYVRW